MAAIVLGTAAGSEPVALPFFMAERATRTAVIGDPALPRLLALRALKTGAWVQVVTSQPEQWLKLRGGAGRLAERMAVVPAGTPPPVDLARAPWMNVHDTSAEPAPPAGPNQAVVAVPDAETVTAVALRGLDAVLLYRSVPAWRAAAMAAMNLPVTAVRSLPEIPRDVVAVVLAGTVTRVQLALDASEYALLHPTVRPQLLRPVSVTRSVTDRDREASLWIWHYKKRAGLEGEVA